MKRISIPCLAGLLLSLVLGCDQPEPPPTPTPSLTPTATLTPSPSPTATATPTPGPLSQSEIFARVSPSIAFIETSFSTGSGILLEDGYVVTNAHVVWPFPEVRVVFPDGSEHVDVPVVNWDLVADLVVLGPLETDIAPLALVDGEDQIIGSEVLLIGYPGEVEEFPQPTITQGLISRTRAWEMIDMTYFQTDALIAGGQSGGALVSDRGQVIGISGFSFTEADFGLVASSADILPRLEQLIAGEDINDFGDRTIPLTGGQLEDEFVLRDYWDQKVYVLNEPADTDVNIQVESENDARFAIIDLFGDPLISVDEGFGGTETGGLTTNFAEPHFLIVDQFSEESGTFQITSNQRLIPYDDVDDGTVLTVGETHTASIDYPRDTDYFLLELEEGETVNLKADSVVIDPFILIDYLGATDNEIVSDDDSGGGVFGLNSEITFTAPHDATYRIVIQSTFPFVGGYFLTVDEPYLDAPTPTVPEPTPIPIDSPVGPMRLYQSAQYPFSLEYPEELVEGDEECEAFGATACFLNTDEAFLLTTTEEDFGFGLEETTLDEFVDLVLLIAESATPGFELVSREEISTAQGYPAVMVEFSQAGLIVGKQLMYLHEGRVAFTATYLVEADEYDTFAPVIEYSLASFLVTE